MKNYLCDNFMTTINLERNVHIDRKIKIIEWENKNITWVWEKKLSQKLSKCGCTNIISQLLKWKK